MAILTADNFKYQGRKPLDSRIVQKTLADMTAMAESIIYSGIICYVEAEQKFYVFDVNNTVDPTLKKWRELTTGGSGNAKINRYKQDTDYKTDEIIIYDDKIYLVLSDFKSDNTQTALVDSFELDLQNNKFVPLDEDTNCVEYKQNTPYKKDTLVYINNTLARVVSDYISDNTGANAEASFNTDVSNGKLIPISDKNNRLKSSVALVTNIGGVTMVTPANLSLSLIVEAKENQLVYDNDGTVGYISNIDKINNTLTVTTITTSGDGETIRYESNVTLDKIILNQSTINFTDLNTIYAISDLEKNQLVYDKDGTVAKIDAINTTMTGTTIDITTITTAGKSFDLEYYKYTKKLNTDIDTTQIILFADLSVASGVAINDLKVNQIIFDEDGTVSKIENINTVDNEVTVRIITKDEMLMKEYKITETINLVVDSQQLVNIPAGTTANEIKIDQLVYDDNGTVAKVISVDTTTNKMMIQTITGLGMPIAPDTKEFKIENGGSGYQVGDIVESLKSGVFVEVTSIDTTTGAILGITDTTQTTSAAHGTQAKISEEQVIYGGYGRNWAQLSDAAVQVAIVVAEKFEYDEGYSFEIVNVGSGYVVGNVIATDNPNVFVSITSVGVSGEILDVQYTRDDNVNASGTGANIAAVIDKNVFIILDKYWNEQGIAIFSLTNDDGAWVEFLRTDDSLIKYSAGPNNKTYKFVYNPVNGTITQSYTECSSGGSAEGITFEDNKNYLENDLIMHNNKLYKCTQDYTSTNDFDTDLVNGYWEQYLVVEIGGEIV